MLILRLITDQLLTYRTQYLTTEFEFPRKSRRDIIFKIISAVFYTFSVFNPPRFPGVISASDTQLPWFTFLEFVMKSYKEFSNYSNSKQVRKLEKYIFLSIVCTSKQTNNRLTLFSKNRFNQIGMMSTTSIYYLQNICCYTDYCVIHKTLNLPILEYQSPYIRPERQYASYFSRFTYNRLLNLYSSFTNGNRNAENALFPQPYLAISWLMMWK